MKLNLGCGLDYKSGYINIDFNKKINADIYHNLSKIPYPFKDNHFNEIFGDNVIEHIPKELFIKFIDEIYRISKNKTIWRFYCPHFTSIYSRKHPTHYSDFGIGTFDIFTDIIEDFNKESYGNGKTKLKVIKERLLYFHHKPYYFKWLSKIHINWLFNYNRKYQLFCEKFLPLKFDEIYYELKVIKE